MIEGGKTGLQSFVLEISCWMMLHGQVGRPVEVDSNRIETLIENNQLYAMQETDDILKISTSVKLLVKMKNVSLILWKKLNGLFGQPSISAMHKSGMCV